MAPRWCSRARSCSATRGPSGGPLASYFAPHKFSPRRGRADAAAAFLSDFGIHTYTHLNIPPSYAPRKAKNVTIFMSGHSGGVRLLLRGKCCVAECAAVAGNRGRHCLCRREIWRVAAVSSPAIPHFCCSRSPLPQSQIGHRVILFLAPHHAHTAGPPRQSKRASSTASQITNCFTHHSLLPDSCPRGRVE